MLRAASYKDGSWAMFKNFPGSRKHTRRISVIICSHNPRGDYLRRALESLQAQTLHRGAWELLLVDNASEQRLADSWDLSWHPNHTHVREHKLGLTRARVRGIEEASGDLLIFVDDDNVLDPDYLERALDLERAHPHLRIFGAGVLDPEFEVQPLPEMGPWLHMLALRTVSNRLWTNNPKDTACVPWGAGLCVTRPIATAYLEWIKRLNVSNILDRRGEHLFCGGDDLFSFAAAHAGYGFGVFPELRITHLIGSHRLTEPYLLRLVHDHAYSHGILRYLLFGEEQRKLDFAEAVRILLHGVRRGRFSMRCRWAAARGRERALRFVSRQGLCPVESIAPADAPTALPTRTVLPIAGTHAGPEPASASNARAGVLFTVATSFFS
jgi:glycosyltransferase involved in cell wall biosynthesis